jgi:hypothetical protein
LGCATAVSSLPSMARGNSMAFNSALTRITRETIYIQTSRAMAAPSNVNNAVVSVVVQIEAEQHGTENHIAVASMAPGITLCTRRDARNRVVIDEQRSPRC